MSTQEILERIDYRLANLDKANEGLKWCYETDPTIENWGNYQNIGGAWSELIDLREEIITLLNYEAQKLDICASCGELNTAGHDLTKCAQCGEEIELCGEGGHIYPGGFTICPSCEGGQA
jgi:hypothetical protein